MTQPMKGLSHAHPFLLAAGVILGTALIPTAATAQQSPLCDYRDRILGQLAQKYGEAPVAVGITGGALIELLTAKSGTWTIILTTPKGMSCMLASGEGWRKVEHEGPEA